MCVGFYATAVPYCPQKMSVCPWEEALQGATHLSDCIYQDVPWPHPEKPRRVLLRCVCPPTPVTLIVPHSAQPKTHLYKTNNNFNSAPIRNKAMLDFRGYCLSGTAGIIHACLTLTVWGVNIKRGVDVLSNDQAGACLGWNFPLAGSATCVLLLPLFSYQPHFIWSLSPLQCVRHGSEPDYEMTACKSIRSCFISTFPCRYWRSRASICERHTVVLIS